MLVLNGELETIRFLIEHFNLQPNLDALIELAYDEDYENVANYLETLRDQPME